MAFVGGYLYMQKQREKDENEEERRRELERKEKELCKIFFSQYKYNIAVNPVLGETRVHVVLILDQVRRKRFLLNYHQCILKDKINLDELEGREYQIKPPSVNQNCCSIL